MNPRVLIADDEELERRALRAIIGRAEGQPAPGGASFPRFEIAEAANGLEALAAAEAGPLACAFLDVRMPGLDGLEAAARIKAIRPEAAVVFLTAYDSFDYARRALRLGAGEYLLKPASAEEVLAVLARCLGAVKVREAESPPILSPGLASSLLDPAEASLDPLGALLALRALELLAARLRDAPSLELAAAELRASASRLSRALSRHAGAGFADCLSRLRIEAAKALLATGRSSVKEASALVGFSDPAYFAKVFRRFEGLSPAEFREEEARRAFG